MNTKRSWDVRCSEILQRMAGHYYDHEIAASIEAETGKRVTSRTVAEYRRAGALPPCRRNDWTAPLKTWRAGATNVTRFASSTGRTRPDEIEITPEMVEAGAEVLRNDPSVGDLPLMDCESVAREVIERALEACSRGARSSASARPEHL
ncbi:MAG: hypothetical protein HYX38_35295 [Rhodospirillales bacterium]|nr:hypothetical protein [Rhodospirillales bacterium]